jgi:hypothetical protein
MEHEIIEDHHVGSTKPSDTLAADTNRLIYDGRDIG